MNNYTEHAHLYMHAHFFPLWKTILTVWLVFEWQASKHNSKLWKKRKKEKTWNYYVMVWCYLLYSNSERSVFVTVILPIWTTCCKHPEGTECYWASKLWPILPLQVETDTQPLTLCFNISNSCTHTHAHIIYLKVVGHCYWGHLAHTHNYFAYLRSKDWSICTEIVN